MNLYPSTIMRILKIQTGSRLEWYPRFATSMTRIHVVLWRSYVHILPPKQLKNKTLLIADVEALLYAPTLALKLIGVALLNSCFVYGCHLCVKRVGFTNRSDHKGVKIKEKFNADRIEDLSLCYTDVFMMTTNFREGLP